MTAPATLASLSGWLYLAATICFIVGDLIRGRIVRPERIAETAENIRASTTLARIGMLVDLATLLLFLLTGLALYALLEHVNRGVAATMIIFVALGVPTAILAVVHEYAALAIATRAQYATALGPAGADALVTLHANTQLSAWFINELISGLWLLPLGYLVYASNQFPPVLGVLLIVGGLGWLIHLGIGLLVPQLEPVGQYFVLAAISEVIFTGWLILRGIGAAASA